MSFAVDSAEGRTLLALRAGAMTPGELAERFNSTHRATALQRCGLVSFDGEFFRLTESGRAACPFRNPLLAGGPPAPAHPPEDSAMTNLRTDILRHVTAAGAVGVPRKVLLFYLRDENPGAVDSCIHRMTADGTLVKPRNGLLVAKEFAGQHGGLQRLSSPPAPSAAPADQTPVSDNNSVTAMAAAIPPAADRGVANPPAGEGAKPPLPAAPLPKHRPGQEDFQFCLWDDGQLDIAIGREIIEIPPAAALRLVKFLGAVESV